MRKYDQHRNPDINKGVVAVTISFKILALPKRWAVLIHAKIFGRFYTEVYRGQSKVINNPQKIINFPPKKSDGRLKTEAISTCFVEIRNTNQQLQHIV